MNCPNCDTELVEERVSEHVVSMRCPNDDCETYPNTIVGTLRKLKEQFEKSVELSILLAVEKSEEEKELTQDIQDSINKALKGESASQEEVEEAFSDVGGEITELEPIPEEDSDAYGTNARDDL